MHLFNSLEEICTIADACISEKCCRTTIYERIWSGDYEALKMGRSTRLLVRSLKAFRDRAMRLPPKKEETPGDC